MEPGSRSTMMQLRRSTIMSAAFHYIRYEIHNKQSNPDAMNEIIDDVLEMEVAGPAPLTHICTDGHVHTVRSVGQCGETCPENSSDHRGACYLDFGHSSNHKCSVDGREW
jgi:hypothetical protein